jgi:DNA-binding transcriptional MerR regulator
MASSPGALRIGEFARRVGVSAELLRAWERRYGLLAPVRSAGGFRLYTDEDAERVARMRRALDDGLSAAQAARVALAEPPRPAAPTDGLRDAVARLMEAIRGFDEPGVHAVLDECLAAFALESVVRDLLIPTLVQVGDEWARGKLLISQEHFASNVIRGRLLSLARLWGRGQGPLALLACVSGEGHDISLLMFGLLLRSYGWRILFLGADTPVATMIETVTATEPAVMVLATFNPEHVRQEADEVRRLAEAVPVLLCGPGAQAEMCESLGCGYLDGDPITAAAEVSRSRGELAVSR